MRCDVANTCLPQGRDRIIAAQVMRVGRKEERTQTWGGKKIKIEKGNGVRRNDESLRERRVDNSSLQADRFAVPARNCYNLHDTCGVVKGNIFQKKQINALQNWFQSKRHNNRALWKGPCRLYIIIGYIPGLACVLCNVWRVQKNIRSQQKLFLLVFTRFLTPFGAPQIARSGRHAVRNAGSTRRGDLDDLWPRLTPVTDAGLAGPLQPTSDKADWRPLI